jgi:hypothetical protein
MEGHGSDEPSFAIGISPDAVRNIMKEHNQTKLDPLGQTCTGAIIAFPESHRLRRANRRSCNFLLPDSIPSTITNNDVASGHLVLLYKSKRRRRREKYESKTLG